MPGPTEMAVIFLIVIVLFGAKNLPKLGEGIGKGIRNFKNSMSGKFDLDPDLETDSKKLQDKSS